MKSINNKAFQPIIYSLILAGGFLLGTFTGNNSGYNKLADVINAVVSDYVDTVSREKLVEMALNGMLQSLDPHSYYISADDYADANDVLQGSFDGIGIQFRVQRDTITVINTISGGPSEKVGIRPGDRIVKIDGNNVAGVKITDDDVLKKLKGKRGTRVIVSVFRRGISDLLEFTIIRDAIPTYSVDAAYMITSDVGFLRVSKFSATTHEEMINELSKLKKQGMRKLILDLRGNGGGYLDAAVKMSSELLPHAKPIVYTQGKSRKPEYFSTNGSGSFSRGALVVLIDEWSASASEIVAGAVQDNDRGVIVGRRSFGKGLVQAQLQLGDGSAVRLTVARYYTPSGRCIQKPYYNGTEQYYSDFYNNLLKNAGENIDSLNIHDSLKYKTTAGRIVYGGGGIMPDFIIPVERDSSLIWYHEANNLGHIFQFSFDLTDKYRNQLSLFANVAEFDNNFTVTDQMYKEFILYSIRNGALKAGSDNLDSKRRICELIKAYVARNVFGDKGFYPIINRNDKTVIKALELIKVMN